MSGGDSSDGGPQDMVFKRSTHSNMSERPHVVFVNCHDLGQHLGCYGIKTVHTPHIDGIAADGVRFTRSFCTAPQCSPSRASMFTGRYPHSNGMMGLAHAHFGWDIHPKEHHLAGILKEAGYRTALVGFQHETRRPEQMRFDTIVAGPESARGEESGGILRQLAATGDPFYCQIGFIRPHRTQHPSGFEADPDDSLGVTIPLYLVDEPSAREDFAGYQGAIRALDEQVGAVVRAIDNLGLRDRTILVFTTDHGIPYPRAKCSLYDPGLEVALIVRYSRGGSPPGTTVNSLISNLDYLPTLLELTGLPTPPSVQGRSFASVLCNDAETYRPRDEIFAEMTYHDYYDPRRCIRTMTHKLIVNFATAPFFMDPSQQWRPKTVTVDPVEPRYAYHPTVELYDLRCDPLERCNLAVESEHATTRQELIGRLSTWMRSTEDPLLYGIPPSPMHCRAIDALE